MTETRRLPATAYAGPDRFERVIGTLALVLLALVITALLRGAPDWGRVPPIVWGHLLAVITALALTPVVLWRRRGDLRHRRIGYVWVTAMALTALASLSIRELNNGAFSLIHLLSVYTLGALVWMIVSARRGDHARHRGSIRAMATGALLIAGVFTLIPARLLGHWLFGG